MFPLRGGLLKGFSVCATAGLAVRAQRSTVAVAAVRRAHGSIARKRIPGSGLIGFVR
jgi:hypothetical protein